jgi:hypothetical protein
MTTSRMENGTTWAGWSSSTRLPATGSSTQRPLSRAAATSASRRGCTLKKLVGNLLNGVDLHPDFDPCRNYALTVADIEVTPVKRNGRTTEPGHIELDV